MHCTGRAMLVKQRTQLVNMIRGLLAEFGIEMARGLHHALELADRLSASDAPEVPALAQRVVKSLADQMAPCSFSCRPWTESCSPGIDRASCSSAWRRSRDGCDLRDRAGRVGERARALPFGSPVRRHAWA